MVPGDKEKNIFNLWVANQVFQMGVRVAAEYLPVQWVNGESEEGIAGLFTLGPTTMWPGGAAQGTAYVWRFPASETPIRGAFLAYEISG